MGILLMGYILILTGNFLFTIIGNAVLGPDSLRESAEEGMTSSIKIAVPLAFVLTVGYIYSLTM
ncbi:MULTISPECIES: hypothetical protein [Paenibacillus]|uniref:hypothetical protein n=1 Tax=Paenibacillus TaxID=44249 RepID=UPI0009A7013E|nr:MULTISPECIES: hypothetical protein [Paenibacillus]MCZ1268587.1 hypothetical protein [Paenibacillus tundrae]SLK16637.1 hypothetical protein SAMN06272722_110212 [Paenibacillus sp. RU5A]SOC74426.1 hypothetical protein SAMN05880581_110212 [Paenibacillus sp. RU26A]SOC76599.1 hypothetical protein SAMN05880586_110212 [Paenibacillus sp. RU5M]